ncbi:efflux RND transporter periplasmic adaptor subunit [Patescibacteria group bacterium]|nr:efflux RND transporter periplasmic adaptor subunit [Patescibacteria group bacterium]
MKKLIKKKWFWILLVIVLLIILAIIYNVKKPVKEEMVTAKVLRGSVVQTVSATGKVESASETNLNFPLTGRLEELHIKAGDEVEVGQLLAQLEAGHAESAVASARANVAAAQADLDKIKAGASSEDIEVAEKSVESAQVALVSAQVALTNAITNRDQGIIHLKNDLLDIITDAIFTAKEALHEVDEILTSSYKDSLGNINRGTYYKADSFYPEVLSSHTTLKNNFSYYSVDNSENELINLASQTLEVLSETEELLDDVYDMLIKTIPTGDLTQTVIDTLKSTIGTEQASVVTKISAVQSDKSSLESDTLSYDIAIDESQAKVDKAEKDLALAESQLALKKADPRSFEIAFYQAKLDNAEASLRSALSDLTDYNLHSPISGLITNTNYEIGEFVSSAEPVVSLIGESNLEIKVDVPESDISKINIGDEAKITLDAFGEDQIFTGHITFIDPAETVINDVVYYKIKVTFDQKDEKVKSGMTANVTVSTASKEDILYIPLRAVIEPNGHSYVRVLINDQIQEKEVITGLRGDGGLVEVISGLNEEEEVITYIKNGK